MKTNRKVVRSVICVLLALIFVVSLMTALIPVNASAASQSEINQLTQQRKELQAKQKEQQKTISNLRAKKASIVEQKAALDQEMNLAQQEIEVVKEQITAYDQQIEDKGVELEAAKQEEEAQTVRFRGCVRHLEEYGQMSYIAILLEATSLSDLLARMDMVGEVIAYNKQVQADMTAARERSRPSRPSLRTPVSSCRISSPSLRPSRSNCSRSPPRPPHCWQTSSLILMPISRCRISTRSRSRPCSRRSTSRSRSCAVRKSKTRKRPEL